MHINCPAYRGSLSSPRRSHQRARIASPVHRYLRDEASSALALVPVVGEPGGVVDSRALIAKNPPQSARKSRSGKGGRKRSAKQRLVLTYRSHRKGSRKKTTRSIKGRGSKDAGSSIAQSSPVHVQGQGQAQAREPPQSLLSHVFDDTSTDPYLKLKNKLVSLIVEYRMYKTSHLVKLFDKAREINKHMDPDRVNLVLYQLCHELSLDVDLIAGDKESEPSLRNEKVV